MQGSEPRCMQNPRANMANLLGASILLNLKITSILKSAWIQKEKSPRICRIKFEISNISHCGRPLWTLPSRLPWEQGGSVVVLVSKLDGAECGWAGSQLKQYLKGKEGRTNICQALTMGQAFQINDHTNLRVSLSGGHFRHL